MAVRTRPTTQADIARAAGVSRGLVSMALSGSGRMKEDTRAHILEVARALDYHPHAAAAELAGGRSNRLVLILPYLINPFFDALARQLRRAARARGYSLVVLVSELGSAEDIESQTIDEAVAMRPAGLIFAGTSLPSEALAGLAERVTVCTLDRELAEGSVWATRMDEARAARLVMDHLAEQGYQRLFFLGQGPTRTRRSSMSAWGTAGLRPPPRAFPSRCSPTPARPVRSARSPTRAGAARRRWSRSTTWSPSRPPQPSTSSDGQWGRTWGWWAMTTRRWPLARSSR